MAFTASNKQRSINWELLTLTLLNPHRFLIHKHPPLMLQYEHQCAHFFRHSIIYYNWAAHCIYVTDNIISTVLNKKPRQSFVLQHFSSDSNCVKHQSHPDRSIHIMHRANTCSHNVSWCISIDKPFVLCCKKTYHPKKI